MQLLFIPKGKSEDLMNYEIDEIESTELEEIKSELKEIDSTCTLKSANLGLGADWILIMAILNGLTTIFLLGDKIDKGISGWIKIATRIKKIFAKSSHVYVDKDIANLMGIHYLSSKHELNSIRIVSESTIPINDLSKYFSDRITGDLLAHPWSLFLTTYEINNRWIVTLAIKSNGEIKEVYSFDSFDQHPF